MRQSEAESKCTRTDMHNDNHRVTDTPLVTRRGCSGIALCSAGISLLPSFEKGEMHTIALVARRSFSAAHRTAFGEALSASKVERLQRVLALHNAMLLPARLAIACWSKVGIRLGVAKDIRMIVSKMVWQDVWRWGEERWSRIPNR
jgi:hypothetical protein